MKTLILSALLGVCLAAPAAAEKAVATDSGKTDTDASVQDKKAADLAAKYGVTKAEVVALRVNQKMGWGEIRHALYIAQESGKSLSEIVAQRKTGKGWGEIANSLGVAVNEHGKGSRSADHGSKGAAGSKGAEHADAASHGAGHGSGHGPR